MELTVIVPVKDRREFVGRTLDSIARSGLPPKEVIIVDNESKDGTYQFCEQYIKDRPGFTLLRETFPGAAAARNKGLKSCKTEWVYFFDSDDEFDYDLVSTLQKADAAQYDMIAFPTTIEVKGKERMRDYFPTGDPRTQILASTLNTQSMVFRTSFLRDIGEWNTDCRIWNDWELGLRALLHQPRVLWLPPHPFHRIHVHEKSITGASFSMNYRSLMRTLSVALRDLNSSILEPLSHYHAQNLKSLYPNPRQFRHALYLRTSILLGQIQREQATGRGKDFPMAARALARFRDANFTPTLRQRIQGETLRLFTQWGGQGAWRAAMAMTEHKK